MKILAVDDKPINNKVIELDIEEYLENQGIDNYTFIEKSNGQEALKIIIEEHHKGQFMIKNKGDGVSALITIPINNLEPI